MEILIIGAGGLLGENLLELIKDHPWLSGQVTLLGGEAEVGRRVEFGRQELIVGDLALHEFMQRQIVIFTGDDMPDTAWLERAQEARSIILDLSSRLLAAYDLPPVVARVNPEVLGTVADGGIIRVPDAATIQLTSMMKSFIDVVEVKKVSVFSCHAVSELGRAGVDEMARQTAQLLNAKPVSPLLFSHQIAFNLIPMSDAPQVSDPQDTAGRIVDDTKSILERPELNLSVSCCWVPVFFGHTQAVDLCFENVQAKAELVRWLSDFPEISVFYTSDSYPTAVTDASGKDLLTIGEIRSDAENSTDFSLWTVADNLRFGNAGNAVKILEVLVKDYF